MDYLHGPGGLIGAIYTAVPAGGGAATATTLYYALDHLGSIAATVNAASTSPVLRSYDGWGKQRFTSGADDTANTLWGQNAELRGFLGQEQVAANGLVNLDARMYDPWLARFLAVDPVIASIYRLQALNPYSYVENNPLTLSDPSGMCFLLCPITAISDFFNTVGHFFNNLLGPAAKPVLAVVAVATFQYEVLPYVEGAEFAQLVALNVAIEGAVGGAINTGTLRGSLIGAATAEAFWGVGNLIQSSSGLGIPGNPNFSSLNSGQVIGAVGLHAAIGCVSSVASGGRCGSGALSAGLGELTTGYTQGANPFVQGAVTALAGGTGAALTGGRFGDGFFIAASGYLFNSLEHNTSSATGAEQSGIQLAAAPVTDPNTGEHLLPGQQGAPVIGGGGASGLGDLTNSEATQIQNVVNQAGRPIEVVGSAARGERGPGSDIDYVTPPSSIPYFKPLQGQLPGIDPNHGIVPGTGNPNIGPVIRFEPQ